VSDSSLIGSYSSILFAAGLALVGGALSLALLLLVRRTRRLESRLDAITRGVDGRSLAAVLEAHLERVDAVAIRQNELASRVGSLDALAARSVQGVGLVRFNTFEDTGGNQSFALALLDPSGDGVVVSSLHTRNSTRMYAKAIRGGVPEGALSAEEAEALRLAAARADGR
jgi:hypothetical protein